MITVNKVFVKGGMKMNKKTISVSLLIAVLLIAGKLGYKLWAQGGAETKPQAAAKSEQRVIKYSIVNIEYQGTKVWVPSVLVVPLGAKVELKLINNTPSGVHGFSIPDFGVKVEVAKGEPKEVSFVADREGFFPINCHLHPAHIGGQLGVLKQ